MSNRRQFLKASAGVPMMLGSNIRKTEAAPGQSSLGNNEFVINEKMQEARDVALRILQPSQKDLEHGMELHYDSLVVESYGFSPRAPRSAYDDGEIIRAIETGASDAEIEHRIEDMQKTRCVTDDFERREYLNAWKAAGVTCVLQNAGEEGNAVDHLLKRLAMFTYVTDFLRESVFKAVTPDDIEAAKTQNRHCLYLSGNGVPLPQKWASIEEELRYIRVFFELGIRMMHLTYNRSNMIGGGCGEAVDRGLTDFGRSVVAEMNKVGVIVDIAHSGWQTSLDAAKVSSRPAVASHSGCAALNQHYRCKPDNVIQALADSGGYIGICCVPTFLGGKGDITAMLDHLDRAIRKFGAEHVAIGTDVVYSSPVGPRKWKKVPKRKSRRRWEALWPPPKLKATPEQRLSMAWTNWPLFTVGLVQRGHSDDDIRKILGGNVMRVARAALA
jgi:membrane dipeptidase